MSRVDTAVRLVRGMAGMAGVAGVTAAGLAAGLAAERATVRRRTRLTAPVPGLHPRRRRAAQRVRAEDGVMLHVEVDEPGEPAAGPGLTIVFTHGYALNLDSWVFQRRDLAGLGRLVLWDQRSHGRSGRSAEDFDGIGQLGRDLGAVLDAVAPDGPLLLVSHSMGGMATLSLVRQRPELVRDRLAGIALLCTSAGGLEEATFGIPGPLGRLAHRVAPGVVAGLARQPDLVERSRTAGSDLGHLLTRRYSFASPDVSPAVVDLVAAMNAATPIEVISAFLPIFDSHDESAALPLLDGKEALVVGAVQDRLVPVEHAREISRALPYADYLELDPCGHMAMLEHPEEVTERLRQLVERARAAAAALPAAP